MYCEYYFTNFA